MLHFVDIWPFPVEPVQALLNKAGRTLTVENNAMGQMGMLLRMMTGHQVAGSILTWDGRGFTPEDVLAGLQKEVR
jgi:pyruvate/2-oxoacid:ferredoxin oxidoreductase alpha subunit